MKVATMETEYVEGFITYCQNMIKQKEEEFILKSGNVRTEIEEIESWEGTLKRAKQYLKLIKKTN